jgi:lipopolysaccharide/colanic/teichoic acid biosynthesis glycosyltransferase
MAVTLAPRRARQPRPHVKGDYSLRRTLDIVGAALLLVLTAPLLLIGVLAVLFGSGTPVFFGHVRIGRGGQAFRCWKLRTMKRGAELHLVSDPELGERHARNGFKLPVREDPRVTRVGAWLRRTHIDELPQLVNVLQGTMSLVGPRPVIEPELAEYGSFAGELLATRPGVFGAWTCQGRRRPPYPLRAHVELDYVRTRSLRRDLHILWRSLPTVFVGQQD